jgi:hypothetical protein
VKAVIAARECTEQTGITVEAHCARLVQARERVEITVKRLEGA